MGSDGCTSPPPVGVGLAVGVGVDDGSPDGVGVGESGMWPWILIFGPCLVSLLANAVRSPSVRSNSETVEPDRATRAVTSMCIEGACPRDALPSLPPPPVPERPPPRRRVRAGDPHLVPARASAADVDAMLAAERTQDERRSIEHQTVEIGEREGRVDP